MSFGLEERLRFINFFSEDTDEFLSQLSSHRASQEITVAPPRENSCKKIPSLLVAPEHRPQ